jgi:hypothetical protein
MKRALPRRFGGVLMNFAAAHASGHSSAAANVGIRTTQNWERGGRLLSPAVQQENEG